MPLFLVVFSVLVVVLGAVLEALFLVLGHWKFQEILTSSILLVALQPVPAGVFRYGLSLGKFPISHIARK